MRSVAEPIERPSVIFPAHLARDDQPGLLADGFTQMTSAVVSVIVYLLGKGPEASS